MNRNQRRRLADKVKTEAANTCNCCQTDKGQMFLQRLNLQAVCVCKVCRKSYQKWCKQNSRIYNIASYKTWLRENRYRLVKQLNKQKDTLEELAAKVKWSKDVKGKFSYTCQRCLRTDGLLESHHLYSSNHYPELRYDLNNGTCLCKDCHLSFHQWHQKVYGRTFNEYNACTLEHYNEWLIAEQEVAIYSNHNNID